MCYHCYIILWSSFQVRCHCPMTTNIISDCSALFFFILLFLFYQITFYFNGYSCDDISFMKRIFELVKDKFQKAINLFYSFTIIAIFHWSCSNRCELALFHYKYISLLCIILGFHDFNWEKKLCGCIIHVDKLNIVFEKKNIELYQRNVFQILWLQSTCLISTWFVNKN